MSSHRKVYPQNRTPETIDGLRGLDIAIRTDDHGRLLRAWSIQLQRWDTKAISVTEEEHALALALSADAGLDPLAPTGALPHCLQEADGTTLDVGAVVPAHNRLDSLRRLISVVERDCRDVVVEDVGLDDAVEDLAADEAELAVNGCGGTTGEVPGLAGVVGEGGVGVLEVGDGDCEEYVSFCLEN